MELRAGYKRTEVGVIPNDWQVSTVGEEFEVRLGKMLDAEKNIGVYRPYIGNRSVQWDGIDVTELPAMAMSAADMQRYRLKRGDLLVCEGGEIGRAAIWDEQIAECYYQKALHRLRPMRKCDPRLMLALLKYWVDHGYLADFVTQTSIAHLTREKLVEVPMPLPPPPEQRAIATALSDVDALLAKLDQLIAKKRDLKQATMQQLLTGQTRLPGFDGEWEVKRLGEVAEIVMGQSPSSSNYNRSGNGLPLIQGNADIENRETIRRIFTTEVTKHGKKGDVLMSVRAPVGEISRATFDVCLGRGVCAIRFPNDFMYHLLIGLEPTWARLSKGSTFDSVNSADVRAQEVNMPSDVREQTAIATVLSNMDSELSALDARRSKTHIIKQGMMQELLTGRIRLV